MLIAAGVGLMLAGGVAVAALSPATILNHFTPGGFSVASGLRYEPGPRGELDVYRPRDARNAPIVVFFYGGSWQEGSRRFYRFVGAALAARGVVAVIPDYRVYPQTRFPGFLRDGAAAVAWARNHAADYGADPSRLFLMGHSAGAYIAAMLALDPEWLAPFGLRPERDVAGLIGLAGPYDFLPLTDPVLQTIFGPAAGLARTQPINFVTPGAPPAFLAAGLQDHTVDPGNTARLAAKLRQAGDAAEVKFYPGIDHRKLAGALSPLLGFLAPVLPDCLAFIRQTRPQSQMQPQPQRSAA